MSVKVFPEGDWWVDQQTESKQSHAAGWGQDGMKKQRQKAGLDPLGALGLECALLLL